MVRTLFSNAKKLLEAVENQTRTHGYAYQRDGPRAEVRVDEFVRQQHSCLCVKELIV